MICSCGAQEVTSLLAKRGNWRLDRGFESRRPRHCFVAANQTHSGSHGVRLPVYTLLSLPDCDAASLISAAKHDDLTGPIAVQVSNCDAVDER